MKNVDLMIRSIKFNNLLEKYKPRRWIPNFETYSQASSLGKREICTRE